MRNTKKTMIAHPDKTAGNKSGPPKKSLLPGSPLPTIDPGLLEIKMKKPAGSNMKARGNMAKLKPNITEENCPVLMMVRNRYSRTNAE
jgi:hypothetical protein